MKPVQRFAICTFLVLISTASVAQEAEQQAADDAAEEHQR